MKAGSVAKSGLAVMMLAAVAFPLAAHGRTPAAVVVELAAAGPSATLAPCADVAIRAGAVDVAERAARRLQTPGKTGEHLYATSGLHRLEDVSTILLLRSPEGCRLVFGRDRGRIPSPWAMRLAGGAITRWRTDTDGGIHLGGKRDVTLAPGHGVNLSGSAGHTMRLYHHGRLEIYLGLRAPKARKVGVDDSASFHLEGPGDEARFVFRARRAGSLILERTPGNMPNLDMLIGRDERDLRPRGMMHVAAGERVLVAFRYRGLEPHDLAAGFLFTPDSTLACDMEAVQISMHAWRVRLWLRNEGDAPVMTLRPAAGTVDWYAGDRLVAAARPARLPEPITLAPSASLSYETILSADILRGPDSARVNLGAGQGALLCGPARPPRPANKGGNK